jgi:hypothetical protein
MSVRRRLKHLEQRLGRRSPPDDCGGLAREVRAIDETAARLEAEIAQAESSMPPEEVERASAEDREFAASIEGLSLDEKMAALEREIAELEAKEKTEERSKRW